MQSWEQGFSEKEKEKNMIRNRRLIASTSSLPRPLVLYFTHSDLFSHFFFPFLFLCSFSRVCVCVCAGALPSWQDSGVIKQTAFQITAPSCTSAASTCFITAEATATVSPLFTAFCPPELSSVRINTQHNTEQEQTIIIHYAEGLSILKTTASWFITMALCCSHHFYKVGIWSHWKGNVPFEFLWCVLYHCSSQSPGHRTFLLCLRVSLLLSE